MKEESTEDDVDKKAAGRKDRLKLAPGVEPSEDVTPLHNAAMAAAADMESTPVMTKDRKEAREMSRKRRQAADVVTKPANKKDRLQLAPGVKASEDITPSHNAAAAAAAINQGSASRRSPWYPSEEDKDDSCSVASSISSGRPGAVRVVYQE
jgi:hypothetical protein